MRAGLGSSVRRLWGRIAVVLSMLVTAVMLFAGLARPTPATAADLTGTGSITFSYTHNGKSASGVTVELHRVATWSKDWNAEPTAAFKNYKVSWPVLNSSGQNELRNLANTLSGYVQRDQMKPLQSDETGADGVYTFTGLPDGLYLITYSALRNTLMSCEASAVLVSLPASTNQAGTQTGANVTVEPKTCCEFIPSPPPARKPSLTVVKVWKDSENKTEIRPSSVEVQLLNDGTVVDEVTLDESNSWTHTWTDLDEKASWAVVEKTVPGGYVTSVERENSTITIVNTSVPPSVPPTNPPTKPVPPTTTPSTTLPTTLGKTGAAVTIVAVAAVIFFIAGLVLRRNRRAK